MRSNMLLSFIVLALLLGFCWKPLYAEGNADIQKGIDLFHKGKVDEAINVLDLLVSSGTLDKFEKERVEAKLEKYREYSRLQKEYLELAKTKKHVPIASTIPTASTSGLADAYVVRPGDTLWLIASYGFIYNDITKGNLIYEANQDQIENPNHIYPGQVLRIKR